ncbi:hypothetical protein GE09DRAFT_1226664 [Coniochaeta sp. 2T2.1]|nr:hypothetical protein GE09DRAFT_1226664 [Coniochaeta sp. 2T2.1]
MRVQLFVFWFTGSPVAALLGLSFFKHVEPGTTRLPQQTGAFLDHGQGVSPRPTSAPSRPQYGQFDLFKRMTGFTMGTDTCGYIATEWDDAFTCVRVGASCTNDGTFIGCCTNTGTDCFSTMKTTCIDYSASLTGACDSVSGLHTLCCTNSLPLCHSYTFSTTASPGSIFTLVNCDSTRGTDKLIDYPPTATRSTTSRSSTTRTPTTSSTSPEPSSSSSTTTSSSSTSSPTPTPTQSSDPGPAPAPVGAIVGGVVGGIAGVGLVLLAALFFWRRSRDKNSDSGGPQSSQLPSPNQPMTQQPSPPGPSPGSPLNPSYSYQPTPSTMYASHATATPPQGNLVYAVPEASHPVSMYGSPPLQQTGWEGVAPAQQAGQYPHSDVHKTPSPVGAGVGYEYGAPPPQQQQQQREYDP